MLYFFCEGYRGVFPFCFYSLCIEVTLFLEGVLASVGCPFYFSEVCFSFLFKGGFVGTLDFFVGMFSPFLLYC
jgi:hypothetical protein